MRHILVCQVCKSYTMQEMHCNAKTIPNLPAKWSPDDKYGSYRLEARRADLEQRGLIDARKK